MDRTYFVFRDAIVINVDGNTHVIPRGDARFDEIVQAIATKNLDAIGDLDAIADQNKIKSLLGL